MADKLKILFTPVDAYGHFNACIGLAEPLRDRGHNVIFAVPNGWKGKLAALGFGEEWYSTEDSDSDDGVSKAPSSDTNSLIETMAHGMAMNPEDQIKGLLNMCFNLWAKMTMNGDPRLKEIVNKIKPDVIVLDMPFCPVALVTSG